MIKSIMRRLLSLFLISIGAVAGYAQNPSVLEKVDSSQVQSLQESITVLQNQIISLEKSNASNASRIGSLEQIIRQLVSTTDENKAATEQLSVDLSQSKEVFTNTTGKLSAGIDDVNNNLSNATTAIKKNSTLGIILFVIVLLLIAAAVYLVFKKLLANKSSLGKLQAAEDDLQKAQKSIQEESIKLDSKIVELFQSQIAKADVEKTSTTSEPDHSLVISIVNEVARIEQNLGNMDSSVRGVSNLKNRAAAITSSLKAKGYEFPKLLGERFSDGDNMIATMELDETLPAGTQIIKRVVKPQVMYKGKMIQAADVVVAYNE